MDATNLNSPLTDADVLITGEGEMDRQTAFGKCPHAVARRARSLGVPVVLAVTGNLGEGHRRLYGTFDFILPLPSGPIGRTECMEEATALLEDRGEDLGRLVGLLGRLEGG